MNDEVFSTLRDRSAALCWAESEDLETPNAVTADFIYLRLRKSRYSAAALKKIAASVKQYRDRKLTVYAAFKHEGHLDGALNAENLLAWFAI